MTNDQAKAMPNDDSPNRDVPFFKDLIKFYEQSPLTFPGVDIFCCGHRRSLDRTAALINVICMMKDKTKRFPVSRIHLVFPPTSPEPVEKVDCRFRLAIGNLMRRLHGDDEKCQMSFMDNLLQTVRCPNLEVDTAVGLVEDAESFSILLFHEAARYHQNQSRIEETDREIARIPEDTWVLHLQSFAKRSVDSANKRNCYVILDAGEHSPYRPENRAILRSVEGCGVLGSQIIDDPRELIVGKLEGWTTQIRAGIFGPPFSEIDALPQSLNAEKRLLKIQLLNEVPFPEQMLEFLRQETADIAEIDPNVLVRFSRFAQRAGDPELASNFLRQAVSGLASQKELELALVISSEIEESALEDICSQRLEMFFPGSFQLQLSRVTAAIDARDYTKAAKIVSNTVKGFSAEAAAFYKQLIRLETATEPDYDSIITSIRSRSPEFLVEGLVICAAEARARKHPEDAVRLLLAYAPEGHNSRRVARSYLRSVEELLIGGANHGGTRDALAGKALSEAIRYLSCNPHDGTTRGHLSTILSPPISGTHGVAFLVAATMEFFHCGVEIGPSTIGTDSSVALQDVPGFLEPVMAWLAQQSPVAIAKCKLPAELLSVPAATLIRPLERLLQTAPVKAEAEGDQNGFESILLVAVLIAQRSDNPCDDLRLLQVGAGRLAQVGRVQRARDLAETALQVAGDSVERRRMAWYVFADTYQRVQNPLEAILAMACTMASRVAISTEQAWYQTHLLIRLLRDLHMIEIAKSLLPVAQGLVREVGPDGQFEHRYITLELSIRLSALLGEHSSTEGTVQQFVGDAQKLCLAVLSRNDEIGPAAALLAEGIKTCRRRGFVVDDDTLATLDRALGRTEEPLSGLIRTLTIPMPNATDVLNLARRLEPARFASDTGFDVRYVVMAARRLLDGSDAKSDPLETAMAIELLADQALRRHVEANPTNDALHGIPASVEGPGRFAEQYSKLGIRVVLLGLSDSGLLVRVTAQKNVLGNVGGEDPETFSKTQFDEWSQRFPYGYAQVADDDNTFYTSTRGLGLTIDASERTLFVMDASLMQLPPNILRLEDRFMGRLVPVAAAPSLAWLRSVRSDSRKTTGQRLAWIPTAIKRGSNPTLAMLADRVSPTLTSHSIAFSSSSQIPKNFAGSDLAIIAAHGGVVREGRFFQAISDDADLKIASGELSSALSAVELVILFVCSGGRFDAYPFANTTVGLVRDLLNRGCRTVIASPWPLDARVPSHWLPEFLKCWESGRFAIDSNFEANKTVEKAMGDGPARCLAMTVFGEPLLTKR